MWALLAAQMLTGFRAPLSGQSWLRCWLGPNLDQSEASIQVTWPEPEPEPMRGGWRQTGGNWPPIRGGRGWSWVMVQVVTTEEGHCRNLSQMMIENKTLTSTYQENCSKYFSVCLESVISIFGFDLLTLSRRWSIYQPSCFQISCKHIKKHPKVTI